MNFLSKSFASLNHTFNATIYSLRSCSRWSVVVELELLDTYMVSVLAHFEKLSQRSFAGTSNLFFIIFCHSMVCIDKSVTVWFSCCTLSLCGLQRLKSFVTVWFAIMFQRRMGKQFQSCMSFFSVFFCIFTVHI